YLNDNRLNGTLPTNFASFSALQVLILSNNKLQGSIPPSIASAPKLRKLLLANNQLSGRLPDPSVTNPAFFTFDVQNNNLSGPITDSMFPPLPKLYIFQLSGNRFTGPVPLVLARCPSLVEVSISEGMECPSPVSACTPSLTSLLASSAAPLAFCSLCPNLCTYCKA
ncbi:unnamed protein product, partial [Closterium sp. Yama58-4]